MTSTEEPYCNESASLCETENFLRTQLNRTLSSAGMVAVTDHSTRGCDVHVVLCLAWLLRPQIQYALTVRILAGSARFAPSISGRRTYSTSTGIFSHQI